MIDGGNRYGSRLALYCTTALAITALGLPAGMARADSDDAAPAVVASGQTITPAIAGGAIFSTLNPQLAAHPMVRVGGAISIAVSPDKQTLLVLTSGYNSFQTPTGATDPAEESEYIFVYDIAGHVPVQKQALQIPTSYAGIAFTPDGQRFLVGSGGGDSVYSYARGANGWAQSGAPIALGHKAGVGNRQGPSTAGLAVTANGRTLLVANTYDDSVSQIDLASGKVTGELDLRPGQENPARSRVAGGETPFWVSIKGRTAYVSSQRDREIDVLDIGGTAPSLRTRIAVRGTPSKMILNRSGSLLFVVADNDDSVQVIDTASNRIIEHIDVAAPRNILKPGPRYRGASPNALSLSADEKQLYVSNGGENAIAVVQLNNLNEPATVGLLPTGYYPNAVAVVNGWLYAVNGKSNPGPNPGECQGSLSQSIPTPAYASTCKPNQYVLTLEHAGFLAEPVPAAGDLRTLTLQVGANNGYLRAPNPRDDATMAALHQRIKHVIYIVKENRTYDQVLGDLGRGNGDPSIVEFGRAITPNFHAIASNFVDLDNFYDSGEVSGNGWPWTTEGRETDFNVKTIPLNYSDRSTNAPYDAEGQVRGVDVGIATQAARKAAEPNYPNDPNLLPGIASDDSPDGPEDTVGTRNTQHGYIWDAVLKAGLTVRNYGFLSDLNRYGAAPKNFGRTDAPIPEDRTPYADRVIVDNPVNPTLIPLTDRYFRGFDNAMPDYWRYREWDREFTRYETSGRLPSLTLLRLMHDHMGSFKTAIDGVNTPELQQADNDYAVGLVAQRVANSRFRNDTLIFVIEDDAQDGPDHVDAHRSTGYVIGPYVKHSAVVSTRYSTVNMLRTIEDVLGTEHLNLNDAYQGPMTDVFDLSQADWTYRATPSAYLYNTTLPLPQIHAGAGPIPHSTQDAAWWDAHTRGYDWSHEDKVPAVLFNQVVWQGLYPGRAYPAVRSGLNFRK